MAAHNSRDFEFKLGKLGLVLFTFGIALLLMFSFLFGVIVGKNIESYPEKIAKGIPKAITQKIMETSNKAISGITKQDVPEEPEPKEQELEKKDDDFKLTFYDKLTKKGEVTVPEEISKEKAASENNGRVKSPVVNAFAIQVASFKNKSQMEQLKNTLSTMGYSPRVEEIQLTSGKWFRVRLEGFPGHSEAEKVSDELEKKIRGLKCMVVKKKNN